MDSTHNALTEDNVRPAPLIARQPVYNTQMGVYGYELLFRPARDSKSPMQSPEATAHVLSSVIAGYGLDEMVYHRKAIINVTPAFIHVMPQIQLPPDQIILDVPDNIRVDQGLIDSLRELKAKGFGISIGGLSTLKDDRMMKLADSFRVDVRKLDVALLGRLTKFLRRFKNLSLRALKIETLAEYDLYRQGGYDLFQGYFLGSPRTSKARDLSVNKLAIMDLLAAVYDVDTSVEELEEKIARDVSLSLKLLRLVNSPFFGVPKEVESVKRAVVLLGRNEVRKLVSLLALSGTNDQPPAMIEIALLRARTCELLGDRTNVPSDGFFTVGMFSALDVLLEQPIAHILSKLPLNEAIKSAILRRDGVMGQALTCMLAIENGRWSDIAFDDLNEDDISAVHRDALHWTHGVLKKL